MMVSLGLAGESKNWRGLSHGIEKWRKLVAPQVFLQPDESKEVSLELREKEPL